MSKTETHSMYDRGKGIENSKNRQTTQENELQKTLIGTANPDRYTLLKKYNLPIESREEFHFTQQEIQKKGIDADYLTKGVTTSNIQKYGSTILIMQGDKTVEKKSIFMVSMDELKEKLQQKINSIPKGKDIHVVIDVRTLSMSAFGGNIIVKNGNPKEKKQCVVHTRKGRHRFNNYNKKNETDSKEYVSTFDDIGKGGFSHQIIDTENLGENIKKDEREIELNKKTREILRPYIKRIDFGQLSFNDTENAIDFTDPYIEFSLIYTGDLTKKDYTIDKDGYPVLTKEFYSKKLDPQHLTPIFFDINKAGKLL